MRRQGVEDIKGKTPLVPDQPPKQHRRRLSKAELREQAEAAFLAWREGQKVKANRVRSLGWGLLCEDKEYE
ncbi:MAG TPA: hypothetical protein VGU64_15340 [Terriglobales bacterium]|jgi:hypothetical protein|nr:hypothetical protein [Terriglobales bacterium]